MNERDAQFRALYRELRIDEQRRFYEKRCEEYEQARRQAIALRNVLRGADIIGAELALRRGASVHLFLALPPEEFVRSSVDLPGTTWRARFEELRRHVKVRVLPVGAASGDEVFARTNEWMVDEALGLDPEPRAIVVWDGKAGDGPGGTADLVSRLRHEPVDPRIRIIDPTVLIPRHS